MTSHSSATGRMIPSTTLAMWALVIAGCSGADLSSYRPLEKSAASKKTATKNEDASPANAVVEEQLAVSALGPVNVVDGASIASLMKATSVEKPVAAEPRQIEVLIPEKTFRTDGASKALRVSYDDLDLLKVLNMEPVTIDAIDHMPAWLKGLNGQRIKIRGYMFPTFETEGIERFVLARDNQICCFGRDPKVYDLVQIDLKAGKTTRYIPATRAFDVVGRLKLEMVAADDKPFGLYFLEDAEVIDR